MRNSLLHRDFYARINVKPEGGGEAGQYVGHLTFTKKLFKSATLGHKHVIKSQKMSPLWGKGLATHESIIPCDYSLPPQVTEVRPTHTKF